MEQYKKNEPESDFFSTLLQTKEIEDVYKLLPHKIKNIIGEGIVITSSLDETTQSLSIVDHAGLNVPLQKIIRILGIDPSRSKYFIKDMTPEELALYRSGKLETLEEGLYALFTRSIPKKICDVLGNLLGFRHVYTMGCLYQGIHYGGVIILTSKDKNRYSKQVEEVVNMAAIMIQRIVVERQLIKAKETAEESDRLKTAFLQNISHEIRTPLNAISGFSNLIIDDRYKKDKKQFFNDIIQENTEKLITLIDNIIIISKLETNQEFVSLSMTDVYALIKETWKKFFPTFKNKGLSFTLEMATNRDEVVLNTDKMKLLKVLYCLLENALIFTPEGTVTLGMKVNEGLDIYVCDTGIGIQEDMINKVFERFFKEDVSIMNQSGGTGMGLTIAKAYVELLGGTLSVTSKKGEGSMFYFTLPMGVQK